MNKVNDAYKGSSSFPDFAKRYFSYITEIQNKISPDELDLFVKEFLNARDNNSTIFVAGMEDLQLQRQLWLMILASISLRKLVLKHPLKFLL